jgi:hypothetical protein
MAVSRGGSCFAALLVAVGSLRFATPVDRADGELRGELDDVGGGGVAFITGGVSDFLVFIGVL